MFIGHESQPMTNTSDLMIMIVLFHEGLLLVSFVSTQELLSARWLDSLIKHWPRSISGFDERSYECWFRQLFCRRYKKWLFAFCESGSLECADVSGREFCLIHLMVDAICPATQHYSMLTLFPITEPHLFQSIEIPWMTDDERDSIAFVLRTIKHVITCNHWYLYRVINIISFPFLFYGF